MSFTTCGVILTRQLKFFLHRQFSLSSCILSTQVSQKKVDKPTSNYREDKVKRYEEFGIIEFVSNQPKVSGVVQRYFHDFHVHEIDESGEQVRLTNFDPATPLPPYVDIRGLRLYTDDRMKYIHFTLYKDGLSFFEAVNRIRDALKIKKGKITYCGRKDHNAVTTQRMCVSNMHAAYHLLLGLSRKCNNLKLGNFSYSSTSLVIGRLWGNHFKFLMRDVQLRTNPSENVATAVEQVMKNLRDKGFINYFGHQRFGIRGHLIGKAVIQMKWQEVFDLILTPDPKDTKKTATAKKIWMNERDPKKMLKCFPGSEENASSEVPMLVLGLFHHYNGGNGDLYKAYTTIPWDLRRLHLTGFASYLWNHVVTFRIQKFGYKVLPGDYVYDVESQDSGSSHDEENLDGVEEEEYDEKLKGTKVKIVSANEVDKYSIYDVLLPVLGSKLTHYPNKEIQQFYEELLGQFELPPDCFATYELNGPFEKGYYRRILIKPKDVNYKVVPYSEEDKLAKIIPTDLDLINWERYRLKKEKKYPRQNEDSDDNSILSKSEEETEDDNNNEEANRDSCEVDSQSETESVAQDEKEVKPKDKTCAVIEFSLPSSSYATMALREIMERV